MPHGIQLLAGHASVLWSRPSTSLNHHDDALLCRELPLIIIDFFIMSSAVLIDAPKEQVSFIAQHSAISV
jgi:hypothetical protein